MADAVADTAQNSIEAGAKNVSVSIDESGGLISVEIRDDGKGMDEATASRAFDPFYTEPGKHDKRRVGLGLPIIKQMCESCGGKVSLQSRKGEGTTLRYGLESSNIDRPPMGDLAGMVLTLFNYPGDFDLVFSHSRGGEAYSISRRELDEAVGGLASVAGLALAKEFLESQEAALP